MRYFEFLLKTTSADIKEKTTKIKLRDFDYSSTLGAVNSYMYRSLENDICFIAYRDTPNAIPAVFSFDDRKNGFEDIYAQITEVLRGIFGIKHFSEPCEITASRFYDCYKEARRRLFADNVSNRVLDTAKLDYFHYTDLDAEKKNYTMKESIIPDKAFKTLPLYDESVKAELQNIETHLNTSKLNCNMAHYFISGKSLRACVDIAQAVGQSLLKANRLSSRRMEVISGISPSLFKSSSYFEELIEDNPGGAVVIDMSEKLGSSSIDYGATCKYIENIFNKYKNDCVFMFTYNIDAPGFAYELLRSISRLTIPVKLTEGKGDRKSALKTLKGLIKNSEYAEYSEQAGEFMKRYNEKEFSLTDILDAFDEFGTWCVNKNILNSAYDLDNIKTFTLDKDVNGESSYEKLCGLVGLKSVKEQIDRIIALDVVEKERKKRIGKEYETSSMHMVFSGNPGTAKTTVAKLFANIAREKGILKSGSFVCTSGTELSISDAVIAAFQKAEGGVLFIDEAYDLKYQSPIATLIQKMEENRSSVIVIFAGYKDSMNDFLKKNEGLKSRIPYFIDFPDYSTDELCEIFKNMVSERGFEIEDKAMKKAREVFDKARLLDNFGNGRYVRNFLEGAMQNQSLRLVESGKDVENIRKKELFLIRYADIEAQEKDINIVEKYGTAQEELDNMIGLQSVKEVIRKIIAYAKMKKMCTDNGITKGNPALHMMFTGNPGTAKTTVARLLARILKDERILASGKFVEVGRADIVGQYVGHTAPLVKQRFKEAQGGVLFIDEAYSLCDGYSGYGDEAINTIVQEMENHRDDVIVIFAGYTDKMKAFAERNPGMNSRIKFNIEFDDYTADELCEITKLMLDNKQMSITDSAMEKLRGIYEKARKDKSFGNGRFVRKMIEDAEMNLAERMLKLDNTKLTSEMISTIEEEDISEPKTEAAAAETRHIGF